MDTEQLKELALAATQGPWWDDSEWSPDDVSIWHGEKGYSSEFLGNIGSQRFTEIGVAFDVNTANGKYIAAANPAAALELIERLESAAVQLAGAQERCNLLLDAKNDWAGRARESEARRDELLAALKDLLEDTQHKDHDCDDKHCPVLAAREAIAKCEVQS